ncbi:MAG: LysR family transcriptional regulator [Sediminimonas qiaohouensis]|uniref:LysR family transcriptional regulator n=1 Tax=Sediminimonas qiaohouensis TaxID=552061 RepID=A0A7C9L996_9RHOB|nr:LysR family transcriptional regulator [Sediminimonas qiaohouensis]MTJ05574.1 LysR family transcriptional regulator [Sediminimonas qiaohouensis]
MIRTEALRTFVTVAECGNIRDAAETLCRTQSAVSMTLKQLEGQLDGALFESDRKSKLTDLGQFVHDVAATLVRDHDNAVDLITGYARGRSGRLRIASVPSVAALILPEVIQGFTRDRPSARIDLFDTDSSTVRRMLAQGRADIGLGSPSDKPEGLSDTALFTDPLHLVCRADDPLAARRAPVEWGHLDGGALILNETLRGLGSADFLALADKARLSVRNVTSLLAMVRAGAGVTILPGLATRTLPEGLIALPLADPACVRQVSLLHRDGVTQSPVNTAFSTHLEASLAVMAQALGVSLPDRPAAQ